MSKSAKTNILFIVVLVFAILSFAIYSAISFALGLKNSIIYDQLPINLDYNSLYGTDSRNSRSDDSLWNDRPRGIAFFISEQRRHYDVLDSNFFSKWEKLSPKVNLFQTEREFSQTVYQDSPDFIFSISKISELAHYSQAKAHIISGYSFVWNAWSSRIVNLISDYNEKQAKPLMERMKKEITEAMDKIFKSNIIKGGYSIDHLIIVLSQFWAQAIEFKEPQLENGPLRKGSSWIKANGRVVYRSDNQEDLKKAYDWLVGLTNSISFKVFSGLEDNANESPDDLFGNFKTAYDSYALCKQQLSAFQTAFITPIRNTIKDEGYLEGKCDRCPTVWRLLRRFFRIYS